MAIKYCNWTFIDFIEKDKWNIKRDCDNTPMILIRGDSRNWKAYKHSLDPYVRVPSQYSKCPNCGKYINGVNPYDDGETWRK